MKHVLMFVALFAVQGVLAGDGVDALAFCRPYWHVYPRGEQWFGHEGSRVESGEAKRWLMDEDHDYVVPIANMTCPRSPWK